jgi:hypothetical protein
MRQQRKLPNGPHETFARRAILRLRNEATPHSVDTHVRGDTYTHGDVSAGYHDGGRVHGFCAASPHIDPVRPGTIDENAFV